jgi:hypothetical protein
VDEPTRMLVALYPLGFLGAAYASIFVHAMLGEKRFPLYACLHWGLAVVGSCALYWLL